MPRAKGQTSIDKSDLVGQKIGKIEVLAYRDSWYDRTAGGDRLRHGYYCHCECGNNKVIRRSVLKKAKIKSCGCTRRKRNET